ncbi:MAG: 3-dehydroquinate synthase [Clostridia bacterium]|nr:3-dehydroquinate synthase [Clostridia bacterium]
MKTITVRASNQYDVKIGAGLLHSAGETLLSLNRKPCSVCILSDDTVYPLYGDTVTASLERAGFTVSHYTIPHGEPSKCLSVYGAFLNTLAQNHFTRTDWLIALGGGVVGDLCGFAAATYLRGVKYMQLPTTLLAMVDSSVGGKTAVDLPAGKNLCGAFYPPHAVLCDTNALDTLTPEIFADGMAEVIKYAMIFDRTLFDTLMADGKRFNREDIIATCIDHKRHVVEEDEFDRGMRQLLNFGHTVAHGIEQHSGYTISHGHAVAAGMGVITRAAEKAGLTEELCSHALQKLLSAFDLPADSPYDASALTEAVLSDKKRDGRKINLVLCKKIGSSFLYPCPVEDCEAFFASGIQKKS